MTRGILTHSSTKGRGIMYSKLVELNKIRTAIFYGEVNYEYYTYWLHKYGNYYTKNELKELEKLYRKWE